MAERIVCCRTGEGYEYLYVDTSSLFVENITDSVVAVVSDAKNNCCLDALAGYALGDKLLTENQEMLFSFDFYKINSFELFKTPDELRYKTGSEKILHSCILNYYRREYDGTQQYAYFSDPSLENTYVGPDTREAHERVLKTRHFTKAKNTSVAELETLDKAKTSAEREAEATTARAALEQQEALRKADERAQKQEKRIDSRNRQKRILEDEHYRELRNRDDVQSKEYQRLRDFEEDMRRNNVYLTSEYNKGNYTSLPGVLSNEAFSEVYEKTGQDTVGIAIENKDLYSLASRMDEFGVPYTIMNETLADGRQISHVLYSSEYAERGDMAKEYFALEKTLQYDDIINEDTYYNAFQLNAFQYAAENEIDTMYIRNGEFNGSQMYKILEAGYHDYDMEVLANPSYTPAHMDALNYYMSNGWDTSAIIDSSMSSSVLSDCILQEEMRRGVAQNKSYFASHDYDTFIAYNGSDYNETFSPIREDTQRRQYDAQKHYDLIKANEKEYSFNASYTPTGYTRSDSSYSPYSKNDAGGYPSHKYPGGESHTLKDSSDNTSVDKRKHVLDDLQLRNEYASRMDLQVKYYGQHIVGTATGAAKNAFTSIGYKLSQQDETGSIEGARTVARYVYGAVTTVQLIKDIPNQIERRKQRKSDDSTKDNKSSKDNDTSKSKKGDENKHKSSKDVEKEIESVKDKHHREIRKKYGDNATKLNVKDIEKEISETEKLKKKEKPKLIEENKKLKEEIKKLRQRESLTAEEAKELNDKIKRKNGNEIKIAKTEKKLKKLKELLKLKKEHLKTLNKLKRILKKFTRIEAKWARLPWAFAHSFVRQLSKANGDHTISGIATATRTVMGVVRNPITRFIRKKIHNRKNKKDPITKKNSTTKKLTKNQSQRQRRTIKKINRSNKKSVRNVKNKLANKAKRKLASKAGKAAGKGVFYHLRATLSKKIATIVASVVSSSAVLYLCVFGLFALILTVVIMGFLTANGTYSSSVMLEDVDELTGKIDISPYVSVYNNCQREFQKEINLIATGTNDAGHPYDNVFYDFNGKDDNNALEIIFMTYTRFRAQRDLGSVSIQEMEPYMQQLFADSNYADYAVSEPYSCVNGCIEREYLCYEPVDDLATETRKSLYASSDHSGEALVGKNENAQLGCVKSKEYSCMTKGHGTYNKNGCSKHGYGAPRSTPCCDNTKVITYKTIDMDGNTIIQTYYSCEGYCPGNHYDYSCPGHTERVCHGEHQDVTITITILGFDDIFYADSSMASIGTTVRGEAYEDTFIVTAYCSCKVCCGDYSPEVTGRPSQTASGTTPKENHTIAVDPKVIPLGTHVWIDGKEYVAEDTGSAIKGNRIDIYFNSHEQALQWGKRSKTVYKSKIATEGLAFGSDPYGFTGWTTGNQQLVKALYDFSTQWGINELYSGYNVVNLNIGSDGSSSYDFSKVVFDDSSGLTNKQQKVCGVINENNVATISGMCQSWVAHVYQAALGGPYNSQCCANHAGEAWGVSDDWGSIQVGATVYGYSSSLYGHVGIYIGNGKVAHNIGYVKIQSLESWVNTYNGVCWGWNGGNNLTGDSTYKCQPAGTFMHGKD